MFSDLTRAKDRDFERWLEDVRLRREAIKELGPDRMRRIALRRMREEMSPARRAMRREYAQD